METKIVSQGFNAKMKAYPMYQTQKYNMDKSEPPKGTGEMTLCSDEKLNVGDGLVFIPHQICSQTQPPLPLIITEITEERKAKGNHKKGVIFYSIKFEFGKQ